MRTTKQDILISLALGDGYLLKDPRSNSVSLQVEHCEAQQEYLEWKRDLILKLLGGHKPIISKRTRFRNSTLLTSYRFTKSTKYFRVIYKWFKEDKTKYSRRILKKLGPAGLAIWVMDDGSTSRRKRSDGSTSNIQFKISTCTESAQEIQTIIDVLFENFGLKFYRIVHMRRKSDNVPLYSVCCGTKEYNKLVSIISPYMCESMRYKTM